MPPQLLEAAAKDLLSKRKKERQERRKEEEREADRREKEEFEQRLKERDEVSIGWVGVCRVVSTKHTLGCATRTHADPLHPSTLHPPPHARRRARASWQSRGCPRKSWRR